MSGKQKECGYSWTSGGEIHTCSLPEGHTEAHICGFVFNPSDCCLERAAPTPPEVEAVPEQVEEFLTCPKCKHSRGFKAEFVWPNAIRCKCVECGEWSTREEWGLEPLPAPVVSTAAPEPYIVVREGHKRECASNLRIAVTQNMNTGVGPAPWQNGKPVYVPIPACNCGAEPAVAPETQGENYVVDISDTSIRDSGNFGSVERNEQASVNPVAPESYKPAEEEKQMFGFMKRQIRKTVGQGVKEGVREGVRQGLDEVMPDLLNRVTTNAFIVAVWAVCKDCKDNSPNPPTYVKSESATGYSGYTHLKSRTQTNEWCAASEIWKLIEKERQ